MPLFFQLPTSEFSYAPKPHKTKWVQINSSSQDTDKNTNDERFIFYNSSINFDNKCWSLNFQKENEKNSNNSIQIQK